MPIRTHHICAATGTAAALMLGGTVHADDARVDTAEPLEIATSTPDGSNDDLYVVVSGPDGGHVFDRGPGDLTSNPAGTCYGHAPTIKAESGVVTLGTLGSDVIVGTDGPDVIYGLGGDDIICGFDGDDVIYGDHDDPISMQGGLDTINGGMGDDTIHGGPWQDFLYGSAGNDTIHGDLPTSAHGFVDLIEGGNGNDHITGGPGNDLIWGDRQDGGFGHDTIDMVTDDPSDHDEAFAGAGNDTIFAQDGKGQNIWAESGRDTCYVDEKIDVWSSCEAEL